jgi:hypothetical protein
MFDKNKTTAVIRTLLREAAVPQMKTIQTINKKILPEKNI